LSEQKVLKCPYCGQGEIITLYTPRTMVTKYGRAGHSKKAINYFIDEKYEIVSIKCPSCGKSKREIEKALKHGKEPSREDIIKRLQEAGLPTKFTSKT